jgi:hypothetical protein
VVSLALERRQWYGWISHCLHFGVQYLGRIIWCCKPSLLVVNISVSICACALLPSQRTSIFSAYPLTRDICFATIYMLETIYKPIPSSVQPKMLLEDTHTEGINPRKGKRGCQFPFMYHVIA